MDQYEKVRALAPQRATYAMYQQALSYGFVDRLDQKISLLKDLITQFPQSSLVDDAQYELALSYTKKGEDEEAIAAYEVIINQTKGSPYRSKALLNKGLIQYNNGATAMAESTLKDLVQTYPNEALAQQALQTVKEIAIEENTVSEFSAWLKEIEIASLPDLQLEKAAFDAIERLLNDGKKKALKRALQSYLEEYSSGGNSLRASFLLAEIAFEEEEWGEASVYYDKVIQAPLNEYSEQSLVRMTQSLVQLEQKDKALPFWEKLVSIAQFEENKRYAQFNLMQFAFEAKNMELATRYAEEILALSKLEERVKWDAYYILAKASQARKDLPKAAAAFKQLEKAPQGERAVEALYFDALQKYNDLKFADSNKVIENIAQNYGGYPRWGAKSLLLMSKNFYQLDDAFQATYILESIIENFNQFPEIIKEARKDIENIKMVEAKNNASISVETPSNE